MTLDDILSVDLSKCSRDELLAMEAILLNERQIVEAKIEGLKKLAKFGPPPVKKTRKPKARNIMGPHKCRPRSI